MSRQKFAMYKIRHLDFGSIPRRREGSIAKLHEGMVHALFALELSFSYQRYIHHSECSTFGYHDIGV